MQAGRPGVRVFLAFVVLAGCASKEDRLQRVRDALDVHSMEEMREPVPWAKDYYPELVELLTRKTYRRFSWIVGQHGEEYSIVGLEPFLKTTEGERRMLLAYYIYGHSSNLHPGAKAVLEASDPKDELVRSALLWESPSFARGRDGIRRRCGIPFSEWAEMSEAERWETWRGCFDDLIAGTTFPVPRTAEDGVREELERGKDVLDWGAGGGRVCGGILGEKRTDGPVCLLYEWDGARIRLTEEAKLGPQARCDALWLPSGNILARHSRDPRGLIVYSPSAKAVLWRGKRPLGRSIAALGQSNNGRYIAIGLKPQTGGPPEDFPENEEELENTVAFGLFDASARKLVWLGPLVGTRDVEDVVATDDGRYIGVVAGQNVVAAVDVAKGCVVWNLQPSASIRFGHIAVATKASVLYAGGEAGVLHTVGLAAGEVVRTWPAKEPGLKGRVSITAVAVSPDERYVAAGTWPYGRTYVWAADTGDLLTAFNGPPDTVDALLFSADSARIASFCKGSVTVVAVP